MDRGDVDAWVQRYIKAWNSNATGDIEALFTDDAQYLTGPFDEAWKGRDNIVSSWLDRKDEPDDTRFDYEVIAVDGDVAVIEGKTDYLTDKDRFANIWILKLTDDGRCRYYSEYWVQAKD